MKRLLMGRLVSCIIWSVCSVCLCVCSDGCCNRISQLLDQIRLQIHLFRPSSKYIFLKPVAALRQPASRYLMAEMAFH